MSTENSSVASKFQPLFEQNMLEKIGSFSPILRDGSNNFPKFSGRDIKKSLKPSPRKRNVSDPPPPPARRLGGRHQQAQRCTIIEAGSITCRQKLGSSWWLWMPLPRPLIQTGKMVRNWPTPNPIGSMYGIFIPTFTIQINHSCR